MAYALCRSCNRYRDTRREYPMLPSGKRDRVCLRCRGMTGVDREFVRCCVVVGFVPCLAGQIAEGYETPARCAALVFRGREAQHLEQVHGTEATPEAIARAFVEVVRGSEEARP